MGNPKAYINTKCSMSLHPISVPFFPFSLSFASFATSISQLIGNGLTRNVSVGCVGCREGGLYAGISGHEPSRVSEEVPHRRVAMLFFSSLCWVGPGQE